MKSRKNKPSPLACVIFYLLPFLTMYLISTFLLNDLYLFKWLADRWYLCLWAVVLLLAYKHKHLISISLTVGSVLGIPLGQFLGDFLRNRNIQSITALMSQEDQAKMYLHHGVAIWSATVILAAILGILLDFHHKKQIIIKNESEE